MPSYVIDAYRIPEIPGAGRLGRHIKVDSRSAAYPYQRRADHLAPVEWPRHAPIYDQGNLGSCTGNAEVGAMASDPLYPALPAGHPALDETLAKVVYSWAEVLDGGAGLPGEDEGSSGQSVCQVAKVHGWISGYTWCADMPTALDALMHGPILLGVNWYTSFDTPDARGVVALPKTATVRGGHEIVCRQYDGSDLLWCDNSWGTRFGKAGRFAFPTAVLERLFAEQGDCAVPLPLTAPAPVPVPVPDVVHVDAADRALAAALPHGWPTGHHAGNNLHAARAVDAWERAKGLVPPHP
jgi:hypothetical protein